MTGVLRTIAVVAETSLVDLVQTLTEAELRALAGAADWYARYHAPTVASEAGNPHALAVVRRDRYLDLITALRKLGGSILPPDGIELPISRAT